MESDMKNEQPHKPATVQQMRQAHKILQLNIHELHEYIEDQVLGNPLLEMPEGGAGTGATMEIRFSGTDKSEKRGAEKRGAEKRKGDGFDVKEQYYYEFEERELDDVEQIPYEDTTLKNYLMTQLGTAPIARDESRIAIFLIEALDLAGYLTLTVSEAAGEMGVQPEDVEAVLAKVQALEPSGVAARDLRECLLIQVDMIIAAGSAEGEIDLARKIIDGHLVDLAENRISNITRALKVSTVKAQEACEFIKTLEPKPGRNFGWYEGTRYFTPDVFIERAEQGYKITVSERTAPKLRINEQYRKYLTDQNIDKNIEKYILDKMQAALWLIKSVERRQLAIYKVTEAIVRNQKEFFDKENHQVRCLSIRQIANEIGVHESTVNRVINDKYLQYLTTIYEMKYFFDCGQAGDAESKRTRKRV